MLRFIRSWLIYTWGGLHRYFGNQNKMPSEHEHAIRYFARAYQIDPKFWQARVARAVLLWRELDRPEEAIDEFTALLAADPNCGPALFNRAMAMQKIGRFQESLADFEAYLQLPEQQKYDQADALRMIHLLRDLLHEDGDQAEQQQP
jgi:tetratricopeptide (TPR) repeat protein